MQIERRVPVKWQGWAVILAFVGILLLNGLYLSYTASSREPTSQELGLFFGVLIVSVILLFWICYKKGDRPRWRWGA